MHSLLFAALAALSVANDPTGPGRLEVQVTQIAADQYTLTANLPPELSVEQAQEVLHPVATQVCAGREVRMGVYRFWKREAMPPATDVAGSHTFEQQLTCGGDAIAATPGSPAPSTPPTAEDERWIREQTVAYLAALDEGDHAFARTLEDPAALSPEGGARDAGRVKFVQANGPVQERRVLRVTWYDNPQGAPRQGRYVAADYDADFGEGAFYCGYLMWYLMADGQFRIQRAEHGQLERELAQGLTPGQRIAVRRQLACRD
jgi:hypothetical protein